MKRFLLLVVCAVAIFATVPSRADRACIFAPYDVPGIHTTCDRQGKDRP
jgi:hypothetical protein